MLGSRDSYSDPKISVACQSLSCILTGRSIDKRTECALEFRKLTISLTAFCALPSYCNATDTEFNDMLCTDGSQKIPMCSCIPAMRTSSHWAERVCRRDLGVDQKPEVEGKTVHGPLPEIHYCLKKVPCYGARRTARPNILLLTVSPYEKRPREALPECEETIVSKNLGSPNVNNAMTGDPVRRRSLKMCM